MARARVQAETRSSGMSDRARRRLREAGALLLLPLAVYLLVCLFSYNAHDPSWTTRRASGSTRTISAARSAPISPTCCAGSSAWWRTASRCCCLLRSVFRCCVSGATRTMQPWEPALRLIGFVFFFITGRAGLAVPRISHATTVLPTGVGGIIGCLGWRTSLLHGFGELGAPLLLLALFLIAITLATGLSWFRVMDWTGQGVLRLARRGCGASCARRAGGDRRARRRGPSARRSRRPTRARPSASRCASSRAPAPVVKSERAKRETQIPLFTGAASARRAAATVAAGRGAAQQGQGYSEETLEVLSRQVEFKLKDFRIDAQGGRRLSGPGDHPFRDWSRRAGVRGTQISSLDKDIARGLSVVSVRVVDVIPGKNVIGLEIPNTQQQIVYLSEILAFGQVRQMQVAAVAGAGQGHRRQAGGGRPGARCRTCWWPAPPVRASRWRSTPWCCSCCTRPARKTCA